MSFYGESETPQECEERNYWRKRFNFASWLFLFFGLYFIFFTDSTHSAALAIGASILWRIVDVVCDIRHLKWHIKKMNGDDHV